MIENQKKKMKEKEKIEATPPKKIKLKKPGKPHYEIDPVKPDQAHLQKEGVLEVLHEVVKKSFKNKPKPLGYKTKIIKVPNKGTKKKKPGPSSLKDMDSIIQNKKESTLMKGIRKRTAEINGKPKYNINDKPSRISIRTLPKIGLKEEVEMIKEENTLDIIKGIISERNTQGWTVSSWHRKKKGKTRGISPSKRPDRAVTIGIKHAAKQIKQSAKLKATRRREDLNQQRASAQVKQASAELARIP